MQDEGRNALIAGWTWTTTSIKLGNPEEQRWRDCDIAGCHSSRLRRTWWLGINGWLPKHNAAEYVVVPAPRELSDHLEEYIRVKREPRSQMLLGNCTLLLKHIDKTGGTNQATVLCGLVAGVHSNVYSLVEQTRIPSLVW
jgi:hypothetical protein